MLHIFFVRCSNCFRCFRCCRCCRCFLSDVANVPGVAFIFAMADSIVRTVQLEVVDTLITCENLAPASPEQAGSI